MQRLGAHICLALVATLVLAGCSGSTTKTGSPAGAAATLAPVFTSAQVVDGGFDHGLTKPSTQWETFVGFTYLLPHRLWMGHHLKQR